MRVTSRMARERRIEDMLNSQERMEQARDRVSSGKRVQRPSDSPAEIAELMRTQANVVELTRRRAAADAWLPSMRASEASLRGTSDALREVRSLTLQGINSPTSQEQRQIIADQIDRIAERVRTLANTQADGRYVFAGTNSTAEPFAAGSPITYTGNSTAQEVSLTPGVPFAVSITGTQLMNTRGGTDLFRNLTSLSAAIRAGDPATMTTGLTELDTDLSNLGRLSGEMGGRLQYIDLMRQQLDERLTTAQGRESQLEDVDLAEAIIEAATAEHAHQATLAMAGRIDQPSLLDFLR